MGSTVIETCDPGLEGTDGPAPVICHPEILGMVRFIQHFLNHMNTGREGVVP